MSTVKYLDKKRISPAYNPTHSDQVSYVAPATNTSTVLARASPDSIAMNRVVAATITRTRAFALLIAMQIILGASRMQIAMQAMSN